MVLAIIDLWWIWIVIGFVILGGCYAYRYYKRKQMAQGNQQTIQAQMQQGPSYTTPNQPYSAPPAGAPYAQPPYAQQYGAPPPANPYSAPPAQQQQPTTIIVQSDSRRPSVAPSNQYGGAQYGGAAYGGPNGNTGADPPPPPYGPSDANLK
uniref:Uncharacterized protein n=1 Tax=Chromera velia CCMP2878 TaxID=1169474 RepID=A0A0G4FCI1_9ALVE|mmetsp:Transcript_24021/g.47166  ORF Transcript_24021/g.47166 Transcript_24021/m.47166 type:complete len:151 (+) Transcript_24021:224-676(+)|eukprot:Cvel_16216.t1-p1 / transcript=Cvel_16216.t1 / gene=Cvel_16216 / organism=Chromera_velia_CCMP2878 / gene_product=hypothetical protein / transcript_product=hypothetical protein / location=Cvel_scaffold1239:34346-34795(+) / protein_length=150 / sequence_SO=supercontig / SO=protein_coding / is_pseudo=false